MLPEVTFSYTLIHHHRPLPQTQPPCPPAPLLAADEPASPLPPAPPPPPPPPPRPAHARRAACNVTCKLLHAQSDASMSPIDARTHTSAIYTSPSRAFSSLPSQQPAAALPRLPAAPLPAAHAPDACGAPMCHCVCAFVCVSASVSGVQQYMRARKYLRILPMPSELGIPVA